MGYTLHGIDLDTFTRQYLETALWSTNDESGGEPMGANYSIEDIASEALRAAVEDCRKFQEAHYDDISEDPSQAGHDFWLTRNGHGCGFFDADWDKDVAERLSKACRRWGELWPYVGDNGQIYGFGE